MTRRRTTRTTRTVAALAAVAALGLTACGGDGAGGGADGTRDSLTWMTMLHTATTPEKGGVVEAGLRDMTGMSVEIQWVPDASKEEKINSALASGSLADLVSLTQAGSTTVRNALASGMFWDVEPYLAEFDNLAQIPGATLDAARLDGTLYGVPYQTKVARFGVLVRQDWLDNLGLDVPRTVEELTEVARAFTEDDPDGNGVDDTVGVYERQEAYNVGFRSLSGYFGAGSFFEVDADDQIVPAFTTDAYAEAMQWYRMLHDNGWMNSEFVTLQKQDHKDGIAQGKGGIVFSGLFEAKNYVTAAEGIDPGTPMEWAMVNDMTWGDVPRRILSDTNGGMGGWLAIPKDRVTSEDDLRSILGFVDRLMEEDAYLLMTNGVEGVHHEVDADGVYTTIDQTRWEQDIQPFSSSRPSELVVDFPSANAYTNLANELMADNAPYAVTNPAQSLTSPTYDQQWSTIDLQVQDAFNQYVMGQTGLSDFQGVLERLRGQDVDAVIAELTAAHQALDD